MKLAELARQPSRWFGRGQGAYADVVISSRVRLARNVAGFPFLSCLAADQRQTLLERLKAALLSLSQPAPLSYLDVHQLSATERELLVERHIISRRLAASKGARGVVFSDDEMFSGMIHEEDHLRLQTLAAGLDIESCWQRINQIDNQLEEKVPYAFDSRLGYLTACPTNLGTGIRVSVMLHLPALKMTSQIEKAIAAARDCDLAVRGLFGEGTEAIGDLFQLSNQITLGFSEEQIVKMLSGQIVPKIVQYELKAREVLLKQKSQMLDDKVHRALGILQHACLISSQEALYLLSNVRLGVTTGRITTIGLDTLNELFLFSQPAHLQMTAGRMLDAEQRDALRAEILRSKLSLN